VVLGLLLFWGLAWLTCLVLWGARVSEVRSLVFR